MNISNTIVEDLNSYLLISDESFNDNLIQYIDSSLMTLSRAGAIKAYEEIDKSTTWEDVIVPINAPGIYSAIMAHVKFEVKRFFDPPASNVSNAMKEKMDEIFWTIKEAYDEQSRK